MKGKFSIPCWFLLIFCSERRHIFALELHVFPSYFLLHSDFSIWSLSPFLNLDPAYDVLSEYQVAYINIENIKTAEFEAMISQLQGNSRNKINVFINPSNTSRLQNISKSISQVAKADKTNPNSLDRHENNWRASYFIFLSATTHTENEIPLQDLLQCENLNTVAKWFTLQSDIYAVKLSKEFTTIVELYSIGKTAIVETIFKKASTYNTSGQLLSELIDMTILRKVSRRRNFHLTPIVAVSQSGSTNRVEMTEYENGSAILISGHEIDEYRFLRDYLNFSEKAVNSSGWAYQNDQGVLMGMASQLLRNEADIAITNSELIETWLEEIVFLHPTFYSNMLCFFVQPPNSSIREIFIQAFTVNVWLAVFSTWIIIISVMISLAWLIQLKLHSLHESEQTFVRELLLWASGSACQQGWYIYPESIPLQIALICSAIMSSVLLIAYSAALVSILSLNILPVKSVDDLIHQKFSIYRGNEIYSTNHVLDELVSKGKIKENQAVSSAEAVTSSSRGILKSKFALIGIADVFHPIIKSKGISDQELCSHLSHVPVNWRPITAAMFLPKTSQYKEYFNFVLVKMHERGNRHRVLNNYMKNSITLCLQNESCKTDPLEMSDVFTAFAIWSVGIILCLVGFSFEKILFSMKRKIFLI